MILIKLLFNSIPCIDFLASYINLIYSQKNSCFSEYYKEKQLFFKLMVAAVSRASRPVYSKKRATSSRKRSGYISFPSIPSGFLV